MCGAGSSRLRPSPTSDLYTCWGAGREGWAPFKATALILVTKSWLDQTPGAGLCSPQAQAGGGGRAVSPALPAIWGSGLLPLGAWEALQAPVQEHQGPGPKEGTGRGPRIQALSEKGRRSHSEGLSDMRWAEVSVHRLPGPAPPPGLHYWAGWAAGPAGAPFSWGVLDMLKKLVLMAW